MPLKGQRDGRTLHRDYDKRATLLRGRTALKHLVFKILPAGCFIPIFEDLSRIFLRPFKIYFSGIEESRDVCIMNDQWDLG